MTAKEKASRCANTVEAGIGKPPYQGISVDQHTTTRIKRDVGVTSTTPFHFFPRLDNRPLFLVTEGMPADVALDHASCMVDALREMAGVGMEAGGITERVAWLFKQNLSTVFALLESIDGSAEMLRPVERRDAA